MGPISDAVKELVSDVNPLYKDQDYYLRLTTGLVAAASFFTVAAFIARKEISDPQGFVRKEGNTFFFSNIDEILGSSGQSWMAAVFAVVALAVAVVVVIGKFRMGVVRNLQAIGMIGMISVVGGGFMGFILNGPIHLGLSAIGFRVLYWLLLPILGVIAAYLVMYYAATATGSVLDDDHGIGARRRPLRSVPRRIVGLAASPMQ